LTSSEEEKILANAGAALPGWASVWDFSDKIFSGTAQESDEVAEACDEPCSWKEV
jgi:hypothetical protein